MEKEAEVIHCVHQTKLCENLNRDGLVNQFLLFQRLKYLNCGTGGDKQGGFLRKGSRTSIAIKLGIGKSTLCSHLRFFVSIGWATESTSGYRLVGWRYFRKYSKKLTKITILDKDKFEYLLNIAKMFIKNNIKQQEYNKAYCQKKKRRLYANNIALLESDEFSMSTRKLASALGLKSATTAVKIQMELERRGEIKVVRRNKAVCLLSDYNRKITYGELNKKKCFVDGNIVYQRMCNNIIPVVTKEDEDKIRAQWLRRADAKIEKVMNPFGKNLHLEFA